mmetsp:Transcript_7239/g.18493  ORF Transcript_7239/g.18493 Transcript_7239/m.18493 type:complete len:219 (-) Transcript_7239:376-1032(-)
MRSCSPVAQPEWAARITTARSPRPARRARPQSASPGPRRSRGCLLRAARAGCERSRPGQSSAPPPWPRPSLRALACARPGRHRAAARRMEGPGLRVARPRAAQRPPRGARPGRRGAQPRSPRGRPRRAPAASRAACRGAPRAIRARGRRPPRHPTARPWTAHEGPPRACCRTLRRRSPLQRPRHAAPAPAATTVATGAAAAAAAAALLRWDQPAGRTP